MNTAIRVNVGPTSDIRVIHDEAFAQIAIDDLVLNFHGLSWPHTNEYHEIVGVLDRVIAALKVVREGQVRQLGPTEPMSELEARFAWGDR